MSEKRTVRGYELVETIGRGGMGAIYRATQQAIGREVAVKVLQLDDERARQRFEIEARTLGLLEHPNIVPVYDYWVDDDGAYIVSRLMRGGSLQQKLISAGALSLEDVVSIATQVGSALASVHAHDLIHRDVKPSNILFDEYGNAFLADLGIADSIKRISLESEQEIIGTPAYMSPEMLQGLPLAPSSDIYAFGIMLWEMLAGHHPYDPDNIVSLFSDILQKPTPSLLEIRPSLPQVLDDVLERATAKDPAARYQSVSAMLEALKIVTRPGAATSRVPIADYDDDDLNPAAPAAPPAPQPSAPAREAAQPEIREDLDRRIPTVQTQAQTRNSLGRTVLIMAAVEGSIVASIILLSTALDLDINVTIALLVGVSGAFGTVVMWQLLSQRNAQAMTQANPAANADANATTAPVAEPITTPEAAPTAEPAPVSFDELAAGDVIDGRYAIKERLDIGDRAKVFHGWDNKMGRDVAIKAINTLATGNNRAARFQQEGQLLSRLHHANIVPYFDYGTDGDVSYIVMPLLEGGSLRKRLQNSKRMTPSQVLAWAQDIAAALDYIHDKEIIHRDLKPTNIVFGEQDKAYLVDFGLAKILQEGNARITSTGAIIGTMDYAAPEQIRGEVPIGASDQYAFAAMLYEVLTGEILYRGETPIQIMMQHVQAPVPSISSKNPEIPASFDPIFARALAKHPNERYPTVRAFMEALAAAAAMPAHAVDGTGHIFISYSRVDGDYAFEVATYLREQGLPVWIDNRINPSDSWWRTIVEAIEGCEAFVVVMSPASEESRWVYRETLLADQKSKPAFPLWLSGEIFPLYVGTQATDVRSGILPPESFIEELRRTLTQDA